jgi:thiol-disulfide isomerase/thioredoxin
MFRKSVLCKWTLIAFIFLLTSSSGFAQRAKDFTVTTTDGQSFHLFEQLEKGNTVILDFFFADCTPCQKLTPAMAKLNQLLQDSGKSVIVLGISDRDVDSILKSFDSTFGVNYISCGTEGGGDTVTHLYKSWFNFTGWPTYAVICSDKRVRWDMKREEAFSELQTNIDTCILTSDIDVTRISLPKVYPNPLIDWLQIAASSDFESVQVADIQGNILLTKTTFGAATRINLSHLKPGPYYLYFYGPNKKGHRLIVKNYL